REDALRLQVGQRLQLLDRGVGHSARGRRGGGGRLLLVLLRLELIEACLRHVVLVLVLLPPLARVVRDSADNGGAPQRASASHEHLLLAPSPRFSQVTKASCAAAPRASSRWGDRTPRSSQPDDEAARLCVFAAVRERKEQPMRTPQDYELQGSYEAAAYEGPRGTGWVMFAAVLLGLAGIWNFLDGILAIGSSRVYAGHHTFVF